MRNILILSLLVSTACSRPNRACILARTNFGDDASCTSISLGETTDYAIVSFDGGEKWCRDAISEGVQRDGGPLHCLIKKPTAKEAADDAKKTAEVEAKTKLEADAKTKVEAEAKARADLEAKSHVDAGVDAK